jgi:multidrug resistance efflux pump
MKLLQRLKNRLSSGVPVVVMLGTFGAAGAVYKSTDGGGRMMGFAQGVPQALAAPEAARITAVHVAVGSEVEPGQLLASLDTSVIDAEIAIAQAEKGRLEASLRSEQTSLGRRLDVDRDALEREVAKEREEEKRVAAEADALQAEIDRVSKLVSEHQAVASDVAQMKLRHAQLKSVLAEKPRTIGVLSKQLAAAGQRKQEAIDPSSASKRVDAELLVLHRKIELLEKRRSTYLLRATHKGKVAAVDKQPGETANAGDSVVKLVTTTNRVSVCVPEGRALGVREGETARLWVRGQRGAPLTGKTVALGAIVSELPSRCWPSPTVKTWGREAIVELDTNVDIVAGEGFTVAFNGTSAATPAPTPNGGAPIAKVGDLLVPNAEANSTARPEPRLMTVAPGFTTRTRFEPSGILTRADENRYLVVSDDTGMDANGAVAAEPIVLDGVHAIDDLEAIAAGDGGEIYVLASQSHNKKGVRSRARSAMLRLRPDGAKFRVDGEVHLAELLDVAPDRAAALGLTSGTRELDIEGMTFHAGALYLGLKAPLAANGDAMIWKVASPKALFDAPTGGGRTLEAADLTTWAHARLDVEVDGQSVPGGISELLFLDQSLAITSTPSTADAAAGALWRVDQPGNGGKLSPRVVQRFPGRKPEGLAPSLTRGNLVVVFDAGESIPSVLETPWPPFTGARASR